MRAIFGSSVRAESEGRAVTPLELFFDLVFVFAIGQLSHHLVDHFDVRTGFETLVLALAVVYAWYMTAWLSNWLSPAHRPVHALLLTVMLGSLLMSSAISDAFGDKTWLFIGPYLAIQLGRPLFAMAAFPAGTNQRTHFENVLIWELGLAVPWMAGALTHDHDARLALWGIAVVLTYAGVAGYHPVPGRPSNLAAPIGPDAGGIHSDLSGEHLLERLRLFFLIALGETIITTGASFAAEPVEVGPTAAFISAFVATVSLWYLYFQRAEVLGLRASEESGDPSGVAALGTQVLTILVIALIAIAVSDEFAIAHPGDEPTAGFQLLAFGGPALFLAGQLLFMWRVRDTALGGRVVAIAALAVLAVATSATTLLTASIAATAVLLAVAVGDARRA